MEFVVVCLFVCRSNSEINKDTRRVNTKLCGALVSIQYQRSNEKKSYWDDVRRLKEKQHNKDVHVLI
jgi:hypothetical protein